MFSSEMLHTIFETDALGPCKILSEYWVSRDSSQAQAVFGFFLKLKTNIEFLRENLSFTKKHATYKIWKGSVWLSDFTQTHAK